MTKARLLRFVGFFVALAAGFATLYAVAALLSDESPSAPEPGEAQVGEVSIVRGGLLTSTRDRLSLCVEEINVAGPQPTSTAVDGADAPEASESSPEPRAPSPSEVAASDAISRAVLDLRDHPAWERRNFGKDDPEVVVGCASPPRAFEILNDLGVSSGSLFDTLSRIVSQPSPHRIQVYIVQPSELERFGGPDSFRLAPEEMVCQGDDCTTVTYGLYLTEAESTNATFLDQWLPFALGLE